MATNTKTFTMTTAERRKRYFSDDLKRRIVNELDRRIITIAEVSREYEVTRASIERWLEKYSKMKKKKQRMVVEPESDTRKMQELQKRIKELELLIGQKQINIEFLEKMIELAEQDLGIDIKKKGKT